MIVKQIGRIFVCFILVFALLINISPIKAHASAAVAAGWVLAEALPIIVATLAGLGVLGISDQALARVFTDYQSAGLIDENGYMEVYSFGDGFYGLAQSVIQFLFDDLYDNGVVVDPSVGYGWLNPNERFSLYDSSFEYYTNTDADFVRVVFEYTQNNQHCFSWGYLLFDAQNFRSYRTSGGISTGAAYSRNLDLYYLYQSNSRGFPLGSSEIGNFRSGLQGYKDVSAFYNASTGGYELENLLYYLLTLSFDISPGVGYEDLELGYVAPSGSVVHEEYTEWFDNSVVIGTGDEEVLVTPIGTTVVGAPPTEYTQEDVQTGTLPIIIVLPETGTGGETEPTEPSEPDPSYPAPIPGDPVTPSFLDNLFGNIRNAIDGIKTAIEELPTKFADWLESIKTSIQELPSKFADWFANISTALQDIRTAVTGIIGDVITTIQGLPEAISGFFTNVVDAVLSIPQVILDGIKAIFVPEADFLTDKVEEIRGKFPFVESITATGKALGEAIGDFYTNPPVIYAELDNASGKYDWGDRAIILDLRWYAEYKPTVDTLISAFLWAVFAWRMYVKLPGIINGLPGDFMMGSVGHIGATDATPSGKGTDDEKRKSIRGNNRRGHK